MGWLSDTINEADDPAAPVASARALDAAFQPSTTRYVLAQYTIQHVQTTGQSGAVKLLSDAANPPTTERAQSSVNNANAATHTVAHQLNYLVPKGHYVKLVSSGTGTPSITQQVETAIS